MYPMMFCLFRMNEAGDSFLSKKKCQTQVTCLESVNMWGVEFSIVMGPWAAIIRPCFERSSSIGGGAYLELVSVEGCAPPSCGAASLLRWPT
jgi:hypothetical protein